MAMVMEAQGVVITKIITANRIRFLFLTKIMRKIIVVSLFLFASVVYLFPQDNFDYENCLSVSSVDYYKNEPLISEYVFFGSTTNIFTSQTKAGYTKFIAPAALISYGIATRCSKTLRQFDYNVHEHINKHVTKKYSFDDVLLFVPGASVFALDWCGVKAKHNFRDRVIVMATANLMTFGLAHAVKDATNVLRPDNSTYNSFPSGHTAISFTSAHILFREYYDVSPWIGIAGYATATTTGVMRVVNKRHWVSDVVTGAGVGILCAELSYLLLPVFHNIFGIDNSKRTVAVVPIIGGNNVGLGVLIRN